VSPKPRRSRAKPRRHRLRAPYYRPRRPLFSVTTIARTLDKGFVYLTVALERLLASTGT
jgi:hypothetical protein